MNTKAEDELIAIKQHITELERQNAVMREAIVRALAWASGESRLLWGGVEEKLKAALSPKPTGKVLVDVEKLKLLEWLAVIDPTNTDSMMIVCFSCGSEKKDGHKDNCWLDAKIKEAS